MLISPQVFGMPASHHKHMITYLLFFAWIGTVPLLSCSEQRDEKHTGQAYHFNNNGAQDGKGSREQPFNNLQYIATLRLQPGDTLYLAADQAFSGSIFLDSTVSGTRTAPIVITSYGGGKAIIRSGNTTALTLHKTQHVLIKDVQFEGAGRNSGNTTNGIIINESRHIGIDSIKVSGFQKSGLLVYASTHIRIEKVYASDNGTAGIYVLGRSSKKDCRDVLISHCTATNNPGDPTNLTNHSGNGILAGFCTNVTIQYSVATNNGWDMPRQGNGPVGIWCYEADSVTIQYCIAYENKTSPGGKDGGGFDLDGGVTNSVIQYCLSYNNQGAGFGIFQYAGASPWHNNTIRYCISENDGNASSAPAGVLIWNSSDDSTQFRDLDFYNNVVYNTKVAAIGYDPQSAHSGFRFFNNIFVSVEDIIHGKNSGSGFAGNNWYSLQYGFKTAGETSFKKWVETNDTEKLNREVRGLNTDPLFENPGNARLTNPDSLPWFFHYRLPERSVLRNNGIDLRETFEIETGGKTFNGQTAPARGIGASF